MSSNGRVGNRVEEREKKAYRRKGKKPNRVSAPCDGLSGDELIFYSNTRNHNVLHQNVTILT